MTERKSQLVVGQTLHGYRDGHELLASSTDLQREARRLLLSMSDLAGHGFADKFDGYLTGYPVPALGKYALGRTWYAHEVERPGCVWTHTLLIDFADLPRLDPAQSVLHYFRRPTSLEEKGSYESPLKIEVRGAAASALREVDECACVRLVDALYGERMAPVLVEASHAGEFDDLVFAIWAQQWPRLRRSFSFCTGALSLRSLGKSLLDLQIVPRSRRMSAERANPLVRGIDLASSENRPTYEEWLTAAVTDLRLGGSPLRTFLRDYGADVPPERASFRPLARSFLAVEGVRRNLVSVDELVLAVGEGFPNPASAVCLKRDIFFALKRTYGDVGVSETDLLLAALRTESDAAFDLEDLGIEERASRVIRSEGASSTTLLRLLLESPRNATGQRLLDDEVRRLDVARLQRRGNTRSVFHELPQAFPIKSPTKNTERPQNRLGNPIDPFASSGAPNGIRGRRVLTWRIWGSKSGRRE